MNGGEVISRSFLLGLIGLVSIGMDSHLDAQESLPAAEVVQSPIQTLGDEPLRLSPPRETGRFVAPRSLVDTLPRTSGQVGIVLGIFAVLLLVWRLSASRGASSLPNNLVEVYGKVPMNGKQSLHLVRIGGRLLILIESAQGMQRLAEITDPDEVRSVVEQLGKGHLRRLPTGLQNLVNERHLSSFRA